MPAEESVRIGEYLRGLREQKGWSAREAARRLGTSQTRLQEVESGFSRTTGKTTMPSVDVLLKAASGYGQPLPLLMELAGLAPKSPEEIKEAELTGIFRKLSPQGQDLAVAILRTLEAQEQISGSSDRKEDL